MVSRAAISSQGPDRSFSEDAIASVRGQETLGMDESQVPVSPSLAPASLLLMWTRSFRQARRAHGPGRVNRACTSDVPGNTAERHP
jgi:hypothetical protein